MEAGGFEEEGILNNLAGFLCETRTSLRTRLQPTLRVVLRNAQTRFASAGHGSPQAVIQAIVGHGNPAMTAHYTHIGEDTARRAAGVLDSGIKDADFEEIRTPLPKWAKDLIEKQNSKNWKTIKKELLA